MQVEQFRLIFSLSLFIILALLELKFSWQQRKLSRKKRWPGNFGLIIFSMVLIKVIFPLGLVHISSLALDNKFGFFNNYLISYPFISISLSIILLDFFIYVQHVISHRFSWLWKYHKVHHTDHDLDVTSAYRFHPGEILISFMFKGSLILVFGIDPVSVLLFEIILNSFAMFNHANLYLPHRIEKVLRLLIVTPQMHYNHHSEELTQRSHNYGFNLSIWDRVFRSYDGSVPCERLGLKEYNYNDSQGVINLLLLPFKKLRR